jgi:cell division protein FtsB
MTMLATRAQASAEQSLVNRLTRENASLERQATELNQTGTIIRDARALGMVRVGERAYVVTPGG